MKTGISELKPTWVVHLLVYALEENIRQLYFQMVSMPDLINRETFKKDNRHLRHLLAKDLFLSDIKKKKEEDKCFTIKSNSNS